MSLRAKTIAIVGIAFLVLLGGLFTLSQTLLMNSYTKLEKQNATVDVQRVLNALSYDVTKLSSTLADWSSWDDTYDYVQGDNDDFIGDNMMDGTFIALELNIMVIVDFSGKVVYAKNVDLIDEAEIALPGDLLSEHLQDQKILISHSELESSVAGIIILRSGPMIVASRPILTGLDEGPIAGTMIMGSFLDSERINRLADQTQLSFDIYNYGDFQSTAENGQELSSLLRTEKIVVKTENLKTVNGYALLSDIYGDPALVLSVNIARDIFRQGRSTIIYFIVSLLFGFIILGALTLLFLEKSILSRLFRLNTDVGEIGSSTNLALRVSTGGNDELSSLAGSINSMLESLEYSQARRNLAEDKLRKVNDELESRVKDRTSQIEKSNEALQAEIIERKRAEERLVELATHDPQTDLPNRTFFIEQYTQALARADRSNRFVALMFLDLDRFKNVNDSLGHNIGDILLKQTADRLKSCLRSMDTVSRWGGDEFTFILEGISRTRDVALLAQKLIDVIKEPFNLNGHEVFITASIGVTMYPTDGKQIDSLIKNADVAMYRAKERGRNNYQFYTADMHAATLERIAVENNLRRALEREEFLLHYQPQADLDTGDMVGVEALVRWQSGELGLVSPAQFIPMAEETGLIVPIGEWILERACVQNRLWQQTGLPPHRVSVNLSAQQFLHGDIISAVNSALKASGLEPKFLELELTEGILIEDTKVTVEKLAELRAMGLSVSVDDFGTGYSSLNYLKRFPLNALKIDGSFVRDISVDSNSDAIVETIIAMARTLGLKVIAEGVETSEQLSFLLGKGCHEIQGYLFSPPMPAEDIGRFVQNSPKLPGLSPSSHL